METDKDNAGALRALLAHGREIRASLVSVLANTDALRRADHETVEPSDRLPYLDAIWRDGSRALDIVNSILSLSATATGLREREADPTIDTRDDGESQETAAVSVHPTNAGGPRQVVFVAETAAKPDSRPPAGEAPRSGMAYFGWLRSRLAHIETLTREGQMSELVKAAGHLKRSTAALGYTEISEAAAAVQRLAETPGAPIDAPVEILRRVVNRAIRKSSGKAA